MKTEKAILLVLFLGLAAFLAKNWELFQDNMHSLVYHRGPAMTVRLNDFSGDMTESKVLRVVNIPLSCVADTSALPLGDRVCHSNINSYADVTALRVAFFFKDGHLANIKIDVPWWRHKRMGKQLVKDFGNPTGAQDVPVQGVRLVGWKLEHGSVLYNRDPDRNPLMWNTIQWIGEQEYERLGGIFVPVENSEMITQ
jgi:hypothetical protein